MYNCFTTAKFI